MQGAYGIDFVGEDEIVVSEDAEFAGKSKIWF